MFVVVGLVFSQDPQEVPLIPDQGAVEQFASASADPVGLEYTISAVTCGLG